MKKNAILSVLFAAMVAGLGGCATQQDSQMVLVQPHIEGRVIDAETRAPIEHVVILRNPQPSVPGDPEYLSAGELKDRQETIYTNGDGVFKVPSQYQNSDGLRAWTSVTLKFLHPDYHMHSDQFDYASTVMDAEHPVLNTGDIAIRRLP